MLFKGNCLIPSSFSLSSLFSIVLCCSQHSTSSLLLYFKFFFGSLFFVQKKSFLMCLTNVNKKISMKSMCTYTPRALTSLRTEIKKENNSNNSNEDSHNHQKNKENRDDTKYVLCSSYYLRLFLEISRVPKILLHTQHIS